MKFEPLVKSENHELFLINDNSKIETEKIKLISDFSLQNPELPNEKLSAIKVLWSNVELSSGVYNEEYLSNLREYLKFLEENSKFVFIYPVAQKNFENPEEAYLRKEAAEERRKALTDKQWEVYVMRYEMGLSQEEIARKLGITPKSVQNRTEGAMKKIKKIF